MSRNQEKTEHSYDSARNQALLSARAIRVYGVPLYKRDDDKENSVILKYCGHISLRKCTDRIFHVTKNDILASGMQKDFFSEQGYQVFWYDIDQTATIVEECYVRHQLAPLIDKNVHSQGGQAQLDAGSIFDSNLGLFGGSVFHAPIFGTVATPIAPIGPTPITPVGPMPIAPVGPTPIAPIGPTPITPVGPTPIAPVGPTPITPV